MTRVCVGTIVTRRHVARARVLAESLSRHHPGLQLVVLAVDQDELPINHAGEAFDVVSPGDIGIDRPELHRLATIYDEQRLCASLEPRLLQYLLASAEVEVAVFIDSEVEIFARLDELFDLAASHAVLLTPRLSEPLPRDGRYPSDLDLLRNGVFDPGFVAVGEAGASFLEWWAAHLARDAVGAEDEFACEHWLDYVPCLFDHIVMRDPGCNVAWWNLGARKLERGGDGYRANGSPLRFFQFAGFDPEQAHLIYASAWNPALPERARVAADHPEMAALCARYADRLIASGHLDEEKMPYPFQRAVGGLPLDRRVRALYREALLADGIAELPDPFTTAGGPQLVEWLREPVPGCGPVTRYLKYLYDEREDLQVAFPDLSGPDGGRYIAWARLDGSADPPIPSQQRP